MVIGLTGGIGCGKSTEKKNAKTHRPLHKNYPMKLKS